MSDENDWTALSLLMHEENRRLQREFFAPVLKMLEKMMSVLTDLQAAVSAQTTIDGSVSVMLSGLSAALTAAQATGNDAQIADLVKQISENNSTLAAAVKANTPAATETAPAPSPAPAGTDTTGSGTAAPAATETAPAPAPVTLSNTPAPLSVPSAVGTPSADATAPAANDTAAPAPAPAETTPATPAA